MRERMRSLVNRQSTMIAIITALVACLSANRATAAEMTFMGETINVGKGTYLVNKDVNIRAKPATGAKRLGKLKAGVRLEVVGRVPKSAWVAAIRDGAPLGFVYGTVLSPVLDGALLEDVTGEVDIGPRHRCGFRVHFVGRTGDEVDATGVRTSDYDASIVCERRESRVRFPAQMFITEVPFDGSKRKRVFQLNVDLLDIVHGRDDVISTVMLFDLDNGQVRFDRVTLDAYAKAEGGLPSLPATSVAQALASALEIALSHWSDTAWDEIFSAAG